MSPGLLATDAYQLNMVEAYLAEDMTGPAVFELFMRNLAPTRGFLLAAGLAEAVRFLETARVSAEDLDWLRGLGRYSERLLDYLAGFRFAGDVDAVPEGTVVFDQTPLLRITAPLPAAQLVETALLNLINFQTMVASKAARMRLAMPDRPLVDFGLRRAQGLPSGIFAARAAYLAGLDGTASVPAGRGYGIPLFGTMAHSFILAHKSEAAAFLAFARRCPDQTTFLLDTYDTRAAAETVVRIAPELAAEGIAIKGVRLDSGDLAAEAREVRRILDGGGLTDVKIMASGNLDEHKLAAIRADGAPIDGFGLGTALVTSKDEPALDSAYKLKAFGGVARRKRSEGKSYAPGPTDIHRRVGADGRLLRDRLVTAGEMPGQGAEALLVPVLRGGGRVAPLPDLEAIRERARAELARLPDAQRVLSDAPSFEPEPSATLAALGREVDARRS
ncbi:MAG: nicotinate phosphoribosyltransferase [Paracoccaceae bacterium]